MIYLYVLVMALTTYLVRMLPLTVFRGRLNNRFIRSFLAYVPITCLAVMIFPSIIYSTAHIISGVMALIVAITVSFKSKSLVLVAISASVTVYLVELLLKII
ncbi:MAG: AzlD domain-containing protein [Clostridia bacterium]|nr:AzlD domain-containing protein [Clostridia bacterium]